MELKPTNRKPLSKPAKKLDKAFSNIDLTEVDSMLTEKEQSFKKKFWDLPKMESLVHSDPILSAEYQEMSEDGQEKYGYHYNETIMNMLFNKYVTNDQGYQQKFINAIPAEKERRDKSGIHQLQQKGEEKMQDKKSEKTPKEEGDVPIHNNSLEGVIEEDIMDNNLNTDGGGTFDDREYQNHRIEKKYDTMKEPIKSNNEVDETTGSASSGAFSPALGGKEVKNNVYENDCGCEDCEDCEENKIDETTTSASSGAYVGPFGKKEKNHVTNKPAWDGGEMIGENYLTSMEFFKHIHESLENDNLTPMSEGSYYADDMPVSRQEQERALENIKRDLSNLMNSSDSNITNSESYKYLVNTAQKISQKLGKTFTPPQKSDNALQKIGKFLGLRSESVDLNEHHLNSREDMVKFILQNGRDKFGDANMLNNQPDDIIKAIYQRVEKTMSSLDPEANKFMEEGEINENMSSREEMIRFILQNGKNKFGDASMLNHQPDDVIKAIYQNVQNVSKSLAPDANKFMEEGAVEEKAVSKNQQQFMGMVHAFKKGELPDASDSVKKAAASMSDADAEDFASTKHDGLPEKVKEGEVNEDLSKTVKYDSERSGEDPFEINGEKWQYVNAIYPDGKKDIGVYRYGHDLVYSYDYFNDIILGHGTNMDENPIVGMAARGAGAAVVNNMMGEANVNENTLNWISQFLQKLLPNFANNIEGYTSLAKSTVEKFYDGDYDKALADMKNKMDSLLKRFNKNEGVISGTEGSVIGDNPTTMASTMKDVQSGGMDMTFESNNLKSHGRADDVTFDGKNSLSDYATSDDGYGGFNGKGDGDHPNYKDPSAFNAPRDKDLTKYNTMTEGKEAMCEDCGSQLDEDGHCRSDEFPVAGKIAGEKGSCKKKKSKDDRADDNKFNVEFRKKKERERENKIEKKYDDYKKELKNSKDHMKKLKEMVEGKDINEDKRPSALVQMDRLHKDNSKNFKADMKDGNTAQIKADQDELTAQDQIEEVPENAYELAEKIEKDKMKQHEFNSFDNDGNSTNDTNKDIPKRNATDEEADDIMLNRGLGQQDIVYDNKPDERFEERMKKDMGEQIYDQRQEKMKFRAEAPMYNKDTQPVEDGTKETQFDKNISKFNNPKGVKENHIVAGKFKDDLNKTKFVNFNINETVEVEKGVGARISLEGMGNTYTQSVNENVEMRNMLDSWDFYMNAGKVSRVAKGKQSLTETEVKKPVNTELEKMMKLAGYKPSNHINTSNTKKNRGF